ncbi:MAG: hypothetical protein IT324_11455 [Anaerolineae bacterium]|nr:hypothetical protein [Anaerolineae bacterium]
MNHPRIGQTLYRMMPLALLLAAFTVALALWSPAITSAQTSPGTASCSQLVSNALKTLSSSCSGLDRNQVCFGNPRLTITFRDSSADTPPFGKAGDVAGLDRVKAITTGALNVTRNEWGLAVLKVPVVNLPGAAAGQAVTFILYGDTSLTSTTEPVAVPTVPPNAPKCNATVTRATYLRGAPGPNEQQVKLLQPSSPISVSARVSNNAWVFGESQGQTGWIFTQVTKLDCDVNTLPADDPSVPKATAGLNAFYFATGVSAQSECKDVPPSGALIQSPSGQKISFRVNGADITVGSTVVIRSDPGKFMTVSLLDGKATIAAFGKTETLLPGQELSLLLGGANGLDVIGPPGIPRNLLNNVLITGTLCQLAGALNLSVPCVVRPPAPPAPPAQPQQPLPQANLPPFPIPPQFPFPIPPQIPPQIPPIIVVPPGTGITDTCSQRTFNIDGTVCIPGYGRQPCNRDGICNNGEHSYICPEDCGRPPEPVPPTTCPSTLSC